MKCVVLVLFVIMLHKWVKKGYPSGKGFLVQWNGFAGGKDFVRGRYDGSLGGENFLMGIFPGGDFKHLQAKQAGHRKRKYPIYRKKCKVRIYLNIISKS